MSRSRQQVVRMLALVPYLQRTEGVPVAEVAAELGVTTRQISEDLRLLMYTGVGEYAGELIDFDLGALEHDGVVHIRDAEFMSRPLRLTSDEGIALIVALRTLRTSASGDQLPIIDSALAKLEGAVSGDASSAPVDVHVGHVDPDIGSTLAQALAGGERVRIEYATASRDERTSREVDPRRLFTEQGQLYLEAWCLRAADLRFFRLDRVLAATATGVPVQDHEVEPRDLSEGLFDVGPDAPHVVLDLEPQAHWLAEHHRVDDLGEVDGRRRVRLFGSDASWLRRLVLRNAGAAHLVEPLSLREEVRSHATSALAAYADHDVFPQEP